MYRRFSLKHFAAHKKYLFLEISASMLLYLTSKKLVEMAIPDNSSQKIEFSFCEKFYLSTCFSCTAICHPAPWIRNMTYMKYEYKTYET